MVVITAVGRGGPGSEVAVMIKPVGTGWGLGMLMARGRSERREKRKGASFIVGALDWRVRGFCGWWGMEGGNGNERFEAKAYHQHAVGMKRKLPGRCRYR